MDISEPSAAARAQYARYGLRTDPPRRAEYLSRGFWSAGTVLADFERVVAEQPERAAIVSYKSAQIDPEVLSFAELGRRVDSFAGWLIATGVGRGDVVSVQLPNVPEFTIAILGALRVGAIVNPLVPILRHDDLRHIVRTIGTKVLVTPTSFKGFDHEDCAAGLSREFSSIVSTVVVPMDGVESSCALSFDHVLAQATSVPLPEPDPDCLSDIQFTSGTTGLPKGVAHSHHTLRSRVLALADAMGFEHEDTAFMPSPLGHSTGFLYGCVMPAALGMTTILLDSWNPVRALDILSRHDVSWSFGSPTFAIDLVRAQVANPIPSATLAHFIAGGAPVPPCLVSDVPKALGGSLIAVWGMTENGAATCVRPDLPVLTAQTSDGSPCRGMELKVVGESAGDPEGDLFVRGPSQMLGYIFPAPGDPPAIDDDGWFSTGDRARLGPHGDLRVIGRTKDVIIRGGENIPVGRVEQLLHECPGVREAALVGFVDSRLGERACAVVVLDEGAEVELGAITEFLASRGLAKPFWPERLIVVDVLPRTPSGKVQKHKIKKGKLGDLGGPEASSAGIAPEDRTLDGSSG